MDDHAQTWAVFWCSLLSPLLFGEVAERDAHRLLRKLAREQHLFPDGRRRKASLATLRRKWRKYRQGGFAALARKPRGDRGWPRQHPQAMIERAVELKKDHVSVDDLQAQSSLAEAAAKCGVTLEIHGGGRQVRLDCPFGCPGDHAGKRELSVDTGNPQKLFACHAYNCQLRGNLLTLMHGWLTGTRPTGDKLKGEEFKRVRGVLTGEAATPPPSGTTSKSSPVEAKPSEQPHNMPLAESANEKARELVTLDEKFIIDVAHIPPSAAAYVRRHPCLSLALIDVTFRYRRREIIVRRVR